MPLSSPLLKLTQFGRQVLRPNCSWPCDRLHDRVYPFAAARLPPVPPCRALRAPDHPAASPGDPPACRRLFGIPPTRCPIVRTGDAVIIGGQVGHPFRRIYHLAGWLNKKRPRAYYFCGERDVLQFSRGTDIPQMIFKNAPLRGGAFCLSCPNFLSSLRRRPVTPWIRWFTYCTPP